jgi:tetratricopeptide (TPR) repeat protein
MIRLDRAIELDPEFAEAYAERAVARILHALNSLDTPVLDFDGAQADIDRALQLKPELGRAHAALGLLLQAREPLDLAEREAILRRSLALDPNQVDAWNWLLRCWKRRAGPRRPPRRSPRPCASIRLPPLRWPTWRTARSAPATWPPPRNACSGRWHPRWPTNCITRR